MNEQQTANLWQKLSEKQLVSGDQPCSDTDKTPWYIAVMVGFGAWLAAIFLAAACYIFFDGIFELNTTFSLILAVIWSLFSWFLANRDKSSIFVDQMSIAAAFVAQIVFIYGIAQFDGGNTLAKCLFILLGHFGALYLVRRPIIVFCLTVGACSAFQWAMYELKLFYISLPILLGLWLYLVTYLERFLVKGELQRVVPMIFALTISIVYLQSFVLDNSDTFAQLTAFDSPVLAAILTGLLALYAAQNFVIKRLSVNKLHAIAIYVSVIATTIAGFEISGLILSVLFLMVGFAHANRLLMGIAVLSLLSFITNYYYTLQATLLEKSQYLLIFGLVLLGVRYLLRRLSNMEVTHHES